MREFSMLGTLAAVVGLAGCSLTSIDHADCTDDAACIAAFGTGFVCGDAGLCVPPELTCNENADCRALNGVGSVCVENICQSVTLTPRCDTTFPDRLLEREDLGDFVVIGNLMDRSNPSQKARENAALLAMFQVDEAGGLAEQNLGMVFCNIEEDAALDPLDRTEAAVDSATWLVDSFGVPAIVGPSSSGDTQAVFTAVRGDDVMLISPAATSPALTTQDNTMPTDEQPGLLWRTAPPDSEQGKLIASDIAGRQVTRVAVINEVGPYGDELSRVFQAEYKAADLQPSPTVVVVHYRTAAEIGPVASQAAALDVEEVVFLSSVPAHVEGFLNAAASIDDFDGKGIFLSDTAASIDLSTTDASRFPMIRGTRPQLPVGETFNAFDASYALLFPGQDVTQFSFAANAYDAAFVTLLGIAWASEQEEAITGPTVARGLRKLSSADATTPLVTSRWQGAVQAFRQGMSIDVEGASGDLDFDPITEEPGGVFECWTVAEDCTSTEMVACGVDRLPITCD